MTNKEIIQALRLTASLLELYGENQFKVRSYQTAVYNLEREDQPLEEMDQKELAQLQGVGKSIASTIEEMNQTGKSGALDNLLKQTPSGILELIKVKGIGAKKIKTAWDELGVESPEDLYVAAKQGELAGLLGFGQKTQERVLQVVSFHLSNRGRIHYKDAHLAGIDLENRIKDEFQQVNLTRVGAFRRKLEVLERIEFLWATDNPAEVTAFLNKQTDLTQDHQASGPYRWLGKMDNIEVLVDFRFCGTTEFGSKSVYYTGSPAHLALTNEKGISIHEISRTSTKEESNIYQQFGWPLIIPELREGQFEKYALESAGSEIVGSEDIRGIIHNHSTYSDGKNTLSVMAEACKALGYQYLGISDHSQTAVYANGLDEVRVAEQHREIEELNQQMAPFKIFKGIESDILNDGDLDYPESVLQTFDFVIASIHFNMEMDIDQATQRLIKAIENPYTTILGHPTGRQLLKRRGYPVDHKKVIDACAENQVVIEINAHPWRLDLDWRWVRYAMDQGVMISINPDAHSKEGLEDVYYGVCVARKAGLSKEMTFNAKTLEEMESYLYQSKPKPATTN